MNAITIKITNEVAPYPTGTKQTNKTTIVKDKDLTPIPCSISPMAIESREIVETRSTK